MSQMRRVLLGSLLALMLAGTPAAADDLGDAKAAGLVGERVDGYLGVVAPSAAAEVVQMVERINRERRQRYQEIATRNGTSVAAVEAIAGGRLVGSAPPGTWVMDASGKWVKR